MVDGSFPKKGRQLFVAAKNGPPLTISWVRHCSLVYPKCVKTHLRAFVISKFFPGVIPPDPRFKRRGGRGEVGREGWGGAGGVGWGGRGGDGKGRGGKGKGRIGHY
jgi:hypothetical protein